MPTYEYECRDCNHNFEVFQSMSDQPIKICPKCGKNVRRIIGGGAGIIFKGSGFYVTDNQKRSSTISSSKTKDKDTDTKSSDSSVKPATEKSASAETKTKSDSKEKTPA